MKIDAVPDEDLVFDLDAVADEGVALDLAARADRRAALDLDERADPRVVADPAPVEVRERLDDDAFAEVDVVDQAVRRLVGGRVSHRSSASTASATAASCSSVMPGKHRKRQASRGERLGDGERALPWPSQA